MRERKGIKLRAIAFACDVDSSAVSRWQDGLIPQEHLAAVAQALDVCVPYLAGWSDEEEPYRPPREAAA